MHSQAERHTTLGVTWIRPLGAMFLALALIATLAVSTTGTTADAGVGEITTSSSMVQMLGTDGDGGPITLAELRKDVLGDAAAWSGGDGIDVAVIDTGVAPVPGLDGDNVLHGPDLSMEAGDREVAFLDTYGHGTHMAGIIAGTRPGHEGIAPNARIISLKVAGHDGVTTVPQVVAAIDWVIDHRNSDGLNIRVLNLSLGQSGIHTHRGDVLSAAVERAWNAGIFVVVAAGNGGKNQKHLDSPAIDPLIMAVGAVDSKSDDPVIGRRGRDIPTWSARGNNKRFPDLVAPGRSFASYRVAGSTVDTEAPRARVGDDLFRGTGTSQSAAAVSGLAAVLLSGYPDMTPEQLRKAIRMNTFRLDGERRHRMGRGHLDGEGAIETGPVRVRERRLLPAANGKLGVPTGPTWSGGEWVAATWSGLTWSGLTWSGGTWSGLTWSGVTWSGATWSGATWSGGTWSGATWSGATWSGATWSGLTWSGDGWS